MKFKKIAALAATVVLSVGIFAGCGSQQTSSSNKKKVIGFAQVGAESG